MANPTITVDQVLVSSLPKYASMEFNDQVFEGLKAMKILMAKPNFKQLEDGGDFLVVPVNLFTNPTSAWIGEWDTFSIANRDTGLWAQFLWKQMAGSIDISRIELAKNSGEEKKINLIQHKMDVLKNTMLTSWTTSFFSDGTANGGLEMAGLQAICNNSGVYGGLDRAVYTAWQSNLDSTSSILNIPDMEHNYNLASHNIQAPDLIISSQVLYEKYQDLARGSLRIQNDEANLGFDNTRFKGAVMIWDHACGATDMYFLNSQQLRLGVHKDNDFAVLDSLRPVNAPVYTQPIIWLGALYALQCRMQARMTNRTAS